jgi:hypothetical protein
VTAKKILPASAAILPLHDQPSRGQVSTYTELQGKIHHALRLQHPEWIDANGDSPICDFYERRLAELIHLSKTNGASSWPHNPITNATEGRAKYETNRGSNGSEL